MSPGHPLAWAIWTLPTYHLPKSNLSVSGSPPVYRFLQETLLCTVFRSKHQKVPSSTLFLDHSSRNLLNRNKKKNAAEFHSFGMIPQQFLYGIVAFLSLSLLFISLATCLCCLITESYNKHKGKRERKVRLQKARNLIQDIPFGPVKRNPNESTNAHRFLLSLSMKRFYWMIWNNIIKKRYSSA